MPVTIPTDEALVEAYGGDYHSPPTDDDFWERWQCIRCGTHWHPGPHRLHDEGCTAITLRPFEIDTIRSSATRKTQ